MSNRCICALVYRCRVTNSICVMRITANRWQMDAFKAPLLLCHCVCATCVPIVCRILIWCVVRRAQVCGNFKIECRCHHRSNDFYFLIGVLAHITHIDPWNGFAPTYKEMYIHFVEFHLNHHRLSKWDNFFFFFLVINWISIWFSPQFRININDSMILSRSVGVHLARVKDCSVELREE